MERVRKGDKNNDDKSKRLTCIQIGNVMLGIKDIEKISIHDGGVWLTINSDLIQGDIETKIGNVKLIAVE